MTAPREPSLPVAGSGELRAPGGPRLHYRSWTHPRPRAALLIVHGLGEHSGRYASLAVEMTRRGISAFAVDLRGHGLSGGQRGHVWRFEELTADLEALRQEVDRTRPAGLPLLLFGHSLGGLVAARYLERPSAPPPHGAILSAPALGLGEDIPYWQRVAARVLSRLLPVLPSPNGIDADHLSHDPREVAAYRADPLVHRWITPRLFAEMERAMERALAERERIRAPTLVLIPEGDRIVSPAATLAFCAGMPFEARRLPGCYHEPLHEVGREEILREVADWLEARIP